MWEEFKQFAMRGNVVDLAVAVIIGVAFGAIVVSLVNDIIMPIIGAATGGARLFELLHAAVWEGGCRPFLFRRKKQGAVLGWGQFLTAVLNFLIVALSWLRRNRPSMLGPPLPTLYTSRYW